MPSKILAFSTMLCSGQSLQLGVRGRNSDNRLIEEKLGWAPSQSLRQGMEITYEWIMSEIQRSHNQR